MDSLFIEAKEDSPEVLLDKQKSIFKVEGNSFLDDPLKTYQSVIDWLVEYSASPNDMTHFDFKLNYVNTASSKQIVNILMILESISGKNNVKVNWHYKEDDDDMFDEGEALSSMIKLDFEFVKY